jgi:N-acetylglucosamine-6-phosphate deacetylase
VHRAPGPVGAFLTSRETYVEMIADGFHVHPAVMEMVIKTKGTDRVILVTDAMPPAGTSMSSFSMLGTRFEVKGNSCFAPDGRLAGTALTMNKAVKVVVDNTSTSLADALKLASLNPARLLGIDSTKGSLEVGKDADIIVADTDLNVHATIIGGAMVHETGPIETM